MNDLIEVEGRKYRRVGGQWYDERGIGLPTSQGRRLEGEWRRRSGAPGPQAAPQKPPRPPSRDSLYQAVYPIVAELIRQMCAETGGWSNHRAIVSALAGHAEASLLIAEIAARQGKSLPWTANNIVQWFSSHYTKGQSPYLDDFERQRQDGVWAYRPR